MMNKRATEYVLLTGSDLGDRKKHLLLAKGLISERIGQIIRESEILETEPWGFDSDTEFLNQALLVKTDLGPEELLCTIKAIECELGREPSNKRWASRIIDIDILCAEHHVCHTDNLSIPHEQLHRRDFALIPLCQLVPDWRHPLLRFTYSQLLENLSVKSSPAYPDLDP